MLKDKNIVASLGECRLHNPTFLITKNVPEVDQRQLQAHYTFTAI